MALLCNLDTHIQGFKSLNVQQDTKYALAVPKQIYNVLNETLRGKLASRQGRLLIGQVSQVSSNQSASLWILAWSRDHCPASPPIRARVTGFRFSASSRSYIYKACIQLPTFIILNLKSKIPLLSLTLSTHYDRRKLPFGFFNNFICYNNNSRNNYLLFSNYSLPFYLIFRLDSNGIYNDILVLVKIR